MEFRFQEEWQNMDSYKSDASGLEVSRHGEHVAARPRLRPEAI